MSEKNRSRKRERDKKYRKHLEFLEDHIGGYTPSASGNRELEELDWELAYDRPKYWKKHPKTYYFRTYPREGKRYQVHRKQSNISVRNYKDEIHKGGMYRKIYDFWWLAD